MGYDKLVLTEQSETICVIISYNYRIYIAYNYYNNSLL